MGGSLHGRSVLLGQWLVLNAKTSGEELLVEDLGSLHIESLFIFK